MKSRTKTMSQAVALFSVACGLAFAGSGLTIDWHTIDGGGYCTGGDFELECTIGQHDAGPSAGPMTGGDFQLSSGFWFEQPPGDCNATGTANLVDLVDLEDCLRGPDAGLGIDCNCFDFDHDGDSDVLDFAMFQRNFTGN